ncbi:Kinase-like protein [Mycena indigotica]|uniref:Kinase-like protein n=1 Tax=Mycena indigotica TaxID=2126181 RepID=A0A8H6WKV3_9AGAR|nr:Kinase-like protein [Mycena indigotica]KAF7316134.1 Kinase-like protein [Mycena indigotica]
MVVLSQSQRSSIRHGPSSLSVNNIPSHETMTAACRVIDVRLTPPRSESALEVVVRSLEYRNGLLELALELGLRSYDEGLRTTLETDETQIPSFVFEHILGDETIEREALRLQANDAQVFMDILQTVHQFLNRTVIYAGKFDASSTKTCYNIPSPLFIHGVSGRKEHPSFTGGFGEIYHASYAGKPVALKRLRYFLQISKDPRVNLKFLREALLWRQLRHPHILQFLGLDNENFPTSFSMVSAWMDNGNILQYLKRRLYEIAQGLQYLHSRQIVHGDLRGVDILITSDSCACLTDFGLSIFSDASESMRSSNRAGSLYWMAPELIDPERYGLTSKFFADTSQ